MPTDFEGQAKIGYDQAETAEWEMRTMADADRRDLSKNMVRRVLLGLRRRLERAGSRAHR